MPLDVTDGPGIDRLGAALYERFGKLDVLLGNAGLLGTLSPIGHIDPAIFEKVMAVNVTANWRLIRSLDPLLRQSDAGRAIFVTSGVSRRIVPYWSAYAASKAALDMMVATYAAESAHTNAAGQPLQSAAHAHGHAQGGLPRRESAERAPARSACGSPDPARAAVVRDEWRMGSGGCSRRGERRLEN